MPLLQTIITEEYALGVWLLSEQEEEWRQLLQAARPGFALPPHLRSEKQRREFAATRLLLHALLGEIPDMAYAHTGKPFLPGDTRHISLSHSASLAAAILSPFPAGIDTEETTRHVESIAPRFLSDQELDWTTHTPNPRKAQIFCWSAKESLYKMMDQPGADFRSQLHIPPTPLTMTGTTTASFSKNQSQHTVPLRFLFSGNNVVTWCVYNSGKPDSPGTQDNSGDYEKS
ncbi:MAG: 4'-phosphopantetheinyl transferase superfamily protein [Prolixibacteraceae bacterium]|nr:4'-phosphopantetheinyl transferase superfamily protein [Prolixibacteraceae bacterium]